VSPSLVSSHVLLRFVDRFYILRDDMLEYLLNDITERLSVRQQYDGWEVSFVSFAGYRRIKDRYCLS
jgi:hypothetical protein